MNRNKTFVGLLSVAILTAAMATACEQKPQTAPVLEPAVHPAQPPVTSHVQPPAGETSSHATGQTPSSVPAPVTTPAPGASDKVSLASADKGEKEGTVGGGAKSPAAGKPKIDIQSPYTQAKPTLLGLSLKTSADTIIGKFGEPKEKFVMEEDADPVTVYNYTDFLIGFNGKKELQFIDVRSSEIDPGLNGLKLGDSLNDVQKSLGKPTSNTNLVVTYKASGAILKLDIDPKSQKVNSIKLFTE